jgi:protein SCO1/2
MLKKYSISLIIAVVLITPITVFALVNWMEKKWSDLPVFEGERYPIETFQLRNQDGEKVTLEQWKGKIVVVNFFFTHCPVICPKMTSNLKTVQASFPTEKNLQFNSFSVDPERDSLQQLKTFAERFGISGDWNLLTGDKQTIYRIARESFSVAASEGDGDDHDFIHSEKLVLLDKTQRIRGYYNGTSATAAQQLIQDIKKLQDEK